jgi:hypothetical protein
VSPEGGGPTGPTGPAGIAFWVAFVVGWTIIGYGAVGLVRTADDTHPLNFLVYFAGSAVAHDLVVSPAVLAVGWFGVRRLRRRARAAAAAALVISGTVALYALPFVLDLGRDPDNPSRLPNNYGLVLGVIIAVVSAGAFIWGVAAARSTRRTVRGSA